MTSKSLRIAVIAGDGIGREVIPAGMAALEAAARGTDLALSFTELEWGCEYYARHGRMMDEDGLDRLATFDAIYLGAIGAPTVPDHIAVWELLLPLRQRFPAVRQPASDAAAARLDVAARQPRPGRHRHGLRPRKHRRRIRRPRRPHPRRHAARGRRADRPLHAARHRAHRALRLRGRGASGRERCSRARPSRTRCATRWSSGTRSRRSSARTTRRSSTASITSTRSPRAWSRTPATLDVIVASNLFGDILTDIGAAISGQPRHRAGREHQPGAPVSVDVRADSRLGAGYRRARASPIRLARSGPAR